jgi:hypothetical protein
MSLAGFVQLVLADGVSTDQERALAAVMLGLVVFAAVFVLVERQRSRRGREARKDPPTDQTGASGPRVAPVVEPGAHPDPPAARLYRPPLANPRGIVPDPMPVVMKPVPAPAPTEDHPSVLGTPASPDEIGIVIPDDQPPPAPQEPPPAG